jgi:ABC-type sugar transport system permease subunit
MQRKAWKPYLYLAPALIFSGLVVFYPIVQVVIYSLSDWDLLDYRFTMTLANYREIFRDEIFWQVILNNAKVLLNVPVQILIAVVFASILFEEVAAWRFYQLCYFLPTILPIIVVGLIWTIILRLDGPLNSLLRAVGLGSVARLWLGEVRWSLPSAVGVMIWKDVGFVILLFLSRLLGTEPEIFDAARIDGANGWQIFRHVKLPELSGIINTYAVLGIIWSFTDVFNYIYVMTAGGPGYSSTVAEYHVFTNAFRNYRIGYASAISVFILVVIVVLVLIYLQARRRTQRIEA